MRAAVLEAVDGPFLIEDVEPVALAPASVRVRMAGAAFCITDCLVQHGALPSRLPTILGHSAIGVVEEAGPDVRRAQVGQRVVVPAMPECRECYFCQRGRADQCVHLVGAPPRHIATREDGSEILTGGTACYAELITIPEIFAFPVESDLPDEQLALMGCGVVSGLGAIFNVAHVAPGDSVAVVGCGHLGLWAIQGARVAGATQIIAVEPRAERRALAGELGATDLVDPAEADPVVQVQALTGGRGADHAIETAGAMDAVTQAFLMARNAGTVVLTGVEDWNAVASLPAVTLALRGRTVRSSQSGNPWLTRDVPRFARMLESGAVDPRPLISRTYGLDEINDAALASEERRDLTGVIVP